MSINAYMDKVSIFDSTLLDFQDEVVKRGLADIYSSCVATVEFVAKNFNDVISIATDSYHEFCKSYICRTLLPDSISYSAFLDIFEEELTSDYEQYQDTLERLESEWQREDFELMEQDGIYAQ